jgi:hypothetical protein
MMAAVAGVLGPRARAAAKPVVLELFTSQGCSSCPPADALLGRLAQRPEVIALAWHVDYWNHLGWRDPYASRQATERQKAYSSQLGIDVFAALVVDGANIVVGIATADGCDADCRRNWPSRVGHWMGAGGLIADVGGGGGSAAERCLLPTIRLHATDVGAGENAAHGCANTGLSAGRNAGRMGRRTAAPAGCRRRLRAKASSYSCSRPSFVLSVRLDLPPADQVPLIRSMPLHR